MSGTPIPSLPAPRNWALILTAKRVALLLAAVGFIAVILLILLSTARGILFREYHNKTEQIAKLAASTIYAPDLSSIDSPDDVDSFQFKRVHGQLREVKEVYDDVAFIYILRRDPETGTWTFVVDADPFDVDRDGDGVISPAEEGVLPGTEYPEARTNPKILAALTSPTAEDDFTTDYWGTFISGYAPIVDPYNGKHVAVLGVDVTQSTFEAKHRAAKIATLVSFLALAGLTGFAFFAYFGKSDALRMARALEREVEEKNAVLEQTVGQLLEREGVMNRELQLAREIQERFLPTEFPLEDDIRFAAEYRACAEIGGDLYDTFQITERSAGFYMADVVGHGVSAALVTAALKATIERSRQNVFQRYYPTVDLQTPIEAVALETFLAELNRAIDDILPRNSFLTILVGIILPDREEIVLGNAGHPAPVLWEKKNRRARVVPVPCNLPVGVQAKTQFRVVTNPFCPGDMLIVYTDGIVERMNPAGESFGMDRLIDSIKSNGSSSPADLLGRIIDDTEKFGAGQEAHDDEALVVIELLETPGENENGTPPAE